MTYINVHCHLFNYRFIPDTFFNAQAPIREWMLKNPATKAIISIGLSLFGQGMFQKASYAMTLLDKPIENVAELLIKEMDEAGILIATPLMMDLEIPSKSKPEIPFLHQIELISDICLLFKGRLLPFVMVDPRRSECFEITQYALEQLGFLGVKMYPPLGINPYANALFNRSYKDMDKTLHRLYTYFQTNKIPITAHCTMHGAYTNELMRCRELSDYLASPIHWNKCLNEYPELKLNLAHYGGDFHLESPKNWSKMIDCLLENPQYPNVFTDLSYQQDSFKKTSTYFFDKLKSRLNSEITGNKILYGSDWPMTRHTWSEKKYLNHFQKYLTQSEMNQIGFDNPMSFLFEENVFPERISKCYKKTGHTLDHRITHKLTVST